AGQIQPRLFVKPTVRAKPPDKQGFSGTAIAIFSAVAVCLLLLVAVGVVLLVRSTKSKPGVAEGEEDKTKPVVAESEKDKTKPADDPTKRESEADIIARCKPATVRVLNRSGTGSGFHNGSGLIFTNAHVVDGDLIKHTYVVFPSSSDPKKKYTP